MILKYQFSETKRVLDDATIAKIIQMGNDNIEPAKIDGTEARYKVIEKVLLLGFKRNQQTEFMFGPILSMIYMENVNNNWNFDYDMIEDLQFTKYEGSKKQHYDWHADQRSTPYTTGDKGMIVKLERLVFLLF